MTDLLEIVPLDAPLGAEVRGLDHRQPLDDVVRRQLADALDEHLALLFHSEEPASDAEVERFCQSFGPLRPTLADRSRLPGHPGINRVSNRDAGGVQGTGGNGTVTWHSDLSFTPPLIEFLYLDAIELPSEGGDTKWVNLCDAYDALDPATKALIADLGVTYRLRDGLDFSAYFRASEPERLVDQTRISLVQVNPRTGRRSVWPNIGPDFAAGVDGLPDDESSDLLAALFAHCTEERFQYRHRWRVGDAALWLNTQTLHEREAFPAADTRVLRHVNILGVADPFQVGSETT